MKNIEELIKYLKSVPKDFIVLINVPADKYLQTNIEVLKVLANDNNLPGLYITVNKPYPTMKRILEDKGVNTKNLYFIDAISKSSSGETVRDNRVMYLDTPQNLTGLGVAMGEIVRSMPESDKFLFLDSLSTLLLYHNAGTVAKFSHFLTGRMRTWGLRGVLLSVEKEADPELTSHLTQFCDAVITLDEK
jgi:KaiC/GvpD/RAD55 family RecA-like ATPase